MEESYLFCHIILTSIYKKLRLFITMFLFFFFTVEKKIGLCFDEYY